MTWGLEDIRSAYEVGEAKGATHMIVSHTSVDFDQTATYVMPGENPFEVWETSDANRHGYDKIDECYQYSLGWDYQSKERRASHWDME